jgi:hypothetical protein
MWRVRGPLQLEAYFCFKPEASELARSELDVRAIGLLFDVQDSELRSLPHLRYLNAMQRQQQARRQFRPQREPLVRIGDSGKTQSHFHLRPTGWSDVPDGEQLLCYREIATKMNWHYLKVDLDLAARSMPQREADTSGLSLRASTIEWLCRTVTACSVCTGKLCYSISV